MKKVVYFIIFVFLHISLKGQIPDNIKKNVEYTLPSGLKIKFTKINIGNFIPQKGDVVEVYYTLKLNNNTLIDKTFDKDKGLPLSFSFGKGEVISGFEEGISYMHIGDNAILTIPPSLGYGDKDISNIPKSSTLIFDVMIKNISIPANCYNYVYDIKGFNVEGKRLNFTTSGLYYFVVEEGTGEKVKDGDKVTVNYTMYLSNGKKFDSSIDRNKAFEFTAGNKEVIEGFDEGVKLMKVGGKTRLIIPYQLGYGLKDMGTIPPKSTLIFDIEVLSTSKSSNTISSINSNTSSGSISTTDAFVLGVTALIVGTVVKAVAGVFTGEYAGEPGSSSYSSSPSSDADCYSKVVGNLKSKQGWTSDDINFKYNDTDMFYYNAAGKTYKCWSTGCAFKSFDTQEEVIKHVCSEHPYKIK